MAVGRPGFKSAGRAVLVPSLWLRLCDSGMLESAVMWTGTRSEHVNCDLRAGSSQHGKQRRASIDSNCVEAISLSSPLTSL